MKRNRSMIIAFALPATIIFFLTFLYPVVRTIFMSFFTIVNITDSFSEWKFNGIGNYISLMNTPLYRTSWLNLFKIFVIGGAVTLSLSLLIAVILKNGVKGKKFFQAAIYLPNVISSVAMATMWIQYVFNSSYGFLSTFFRVLHLDSLANTQWLDSDHKFWCLLYSYCFGMVGHFMLIWISGLERINEEYYEAAAIDGASKIHSFFYITCPLLKGIFRTNIIMWTISVSGFFTWTKLFSPLSTDTSTVVPMVYMYDKLFGVESSGNVTRDAGMASAIGVMLAAFIVIVYTIVTKVIHNDDLEF
ncbi:MAG: sugar ABC transporter permease [Lachnospiraceae bacterium]|nr:sugar ABC transporter permease [Lachnospiraceae bacterium]MCH4032338.1 sugar ABC transporter permease [Lachnospiraceae bacterium]MCH4108784.1 sugar ABC transporter permease [Lachnospiraceae bacterium]MCI1302315.1 sugar ABC transporter permease [Lachnospiraceae bacterium]MCI1331481.1 sugar ABC transporter permease [Lachnospiraceae bacterium]